MAVVPQSATLPPEILEVLCLEEAHLDCSPM